MAPQIADKVAEVYEWLDADERAELEQLVKADSRVTDPLARLFDPSFTATTWPYEFSQTDPEIPGSLHPKQVEALHADSRQRWLFWGNQVGKTTVGADQYVAFRRVRVGRGRVYQPVPRDPRQQLGQENLLPQLPR